LAVAQPFLFVFVLDPLRLLTFIPVNYIIKQIIYDSIHRYCREGKPMKKDQSSRSCFGGNDDWRCVYGMRVNHQQYDQGWPDCASDRRSRGLRHAVKDAVEFVQGAV
jgi:hypothetical protein